MATLTRERHEAAKKKGHGARNARPFVIAALVGCDLGLNATEERKLQLWTERLEGAIRAWEHREKRRAEGVAHVE